MEVGADLSPAALAAAMPDRPVRTYPALLSTAADALSWARVAAAAGSVVVADYQASPRGRAGLEWQVEAGRGLGFSLVVRPALPAAREGWVYVAATSALAELVDPGATISWPDVARGDGGRSALVGVETAEEAGRITWAVVNVLLPHVEPPRAGVLARAVGAIEAQLEADPDELLGAYRPRCVTIGHTVTAHLVPVGPNGVTVQGTAVDVATDGALVILTEDGRRVGVRAPHLGYLEDA